MLWNLLTFYPYLSSLECCVHQLQYSSVLYSQCVHKNMARMRSLIMILLPLFLFLHLHCLDLFRFELISCEYIWCDGVTDPCHQQTTRCFQHSRGGCHTASPDRHCWLSELGQEVNIYIEMLEMISRENIIFQLCD